MGLPVLALRGAGWAFLIHPEPVANLSAGLAQPQCGSKEPLWHRSWSPFSLGITPLGAASPQVLSFLQYCISLGVTPRVSHLLGYCVVSPWVSRLWVLRLLGYWAFAYRASSIVVSPGVMLPGVMPPWMSCHWVLCLFGCVASWDIMPWDIAPLGTVLPWVLCFLEYCVSLCTWSPAIVAPSMFCLWVSHPWISVLLGCHASRRHASLDIAYLGVGSPQVSCFWLLYRRVPPSVTPLGPCLWVPHLWVPHLWVPCLSVPCLWVSCWLWFQAGHRAMLGQCWCL